MRELIVLGTASQAPTRHRNHNGYLLRWDGEGLLFDPGEERNECLRIFHSDIPTRRGTAMRRPRCSAACPRTQPGFRSQRQ